MRPALVTILTCLLIVLPPQPAVAAMVLDPPVQGPILARFHAPTTYGPGHRGVDLGAPVGTTVRASAAGRVTFAGSVVGSRWVTVDLGGLRTTVGPLNTIRAETGQRVVRGSVLGTSGLAHGVAAVHWSARRGGVYVDPLAPWLRVATLVPSVRRATVARVISRADPPALSRWVPTRVR